MFRWETYKLKFVTCHYLRVVWTEWAELASLRSFFHPEAGHAGKRGARLEYSTKINHGSDIAKQGSQATSWEDLCLLPQEAPVGDF